ncbi:NADPH2:quinone reductase [Micrococcales bacterium KH10]|nr:NADPH2:quinone reductase [Micrococcales bacterium KH10]
MEAIVAARAGGPEELVLTETDRPLLADGEVLVRVAYAGVNFIDVYRRTGQYPVDFPNVPGSEGSGVVCEVDDAVTSVQVGDRVAWVDGTSSYAAYVSVAADRLIRVPDAIDLDVAAAAALQGLTAHYLATSTFPIELSDDVLIHAGAGGVGLLLTQMARLRGAERIITTTSTPSKAELSRQAGATNTLNYTEFTDIADELPRAVKALTGGNGVQVVYDGVGRTTFDASLASLTSRGMLVLFGASSGPVPPFELQRLNSGGSLYVTRPSLWHYVETRDELTRRSGELFDWIARGDVTVHIGREFPLAEAAAAHRFLESRQSTGKVLLAVDPE